MEKLSYTVEINAPKNIVWQVLWGEDTYPKWTSAFSADSKAITDWKEGSKILFLDGSGMGMVSRIAALKPNEYMSFEHLGEVKDGVEDTTSDRVKEWAGAEENYTLTEKNGTTIVKVEIDCNGEFKAFFENTWPMAMKQLKEISEK